MKNSIKKILVNAILLALPTTAFAITTFGELLAWLASAINAIAYLIISFAVLVFLFGILKFIVSAGDEKARKDGISLIVWGIVGLAIMVSVWGLVNVLVSSFSLTPTRPATPTLTTS